MKNLLLTAALLISLSALNLFSQSPEKMIEEFFDTYEKNRPVEALDELYANSPWLERIRDDVEQLKSQFKDLKNIVGEYNGHEMLYKKNVKDCFLVVTYLIKFDRQPIRFVFEFYKPKEAWYLYGFSYDDGFADDLQEIMKHEIIKDENE